MLSILTKNRYWAKIFTDSAFWISVTFVAYWLRLENGVFNHLADVFIVALAIAPFKLLSIYVFGHHRHSWQYSSVQDLMDLLQSVGVVTLFYFVAAFFARDFVLIPLSVPLIEGALAILGLGMVRFMVRIYLKEYYQKPKKRSNRRNVIIAGAGDSGTMIAREMLRHPDQGLIPVAFLDDDTGLWNRKLMGLPVVGRLSKMKEAIDKYDADELIIAMPSESGDVIRRVVELAQACKIPHRTIPGLHDLISGKVGINQLRKVDVEDLLRREPVQLQTDKIEAYVKDRKILVTGAGGSIGSEIVRQVSRFEPECIVLLGRGENSIYHIVREMKADFPHIRIHIKIADVRDIDTMEKIFEEIKPEVIFHAAAHKHVPLMEKNPAQAIFNNVGGTKNLTDLALEFNVKYFVNISTDKAVNPTSVMGASKRIAEQVVQNAAAKAGEDQYFVSVRFGNVLGSRGSVIPIFREQIRNGGPITITHPDMIRYFMTIPEASQLVLQAGALNRNGSVFVLDMGSPVRILDMAKDLIKLSGLEPDKDIKIKFTGIRPGEKLYEELLTSEEGTEVTNFEKIMVARKNGMKEDFPEKLDKLFETARQGEVSGIKSMIHTLVPSYVGIEQGKHTGKNKD